MQIFQTIADMVQSFSAGVSLEFYAFFVSIAEEVIAIIPSPFVMMSAGTMAEAQSKTFIFLFWLGLLGAVGKTFGAWIVYVISDKMEDLVIGKWGKFFGVSHELIEGMGKKMKGGWRDYVVLFLMRSAPVIPSAPLSVGCGVIKLDMRTYIISTFCGTYIRNMFFLWLGYAGYAGYEKVTHGVNLMESISQVVAVAAVIGVFLWWRLKARKIEK